MVFPGLASIGTVLVGGAAFAAFALIAPRSTPFERDQLIASTGYADALRRREPAVGFGLGYRREIPSWSLRPFASAFVTSSGAFYGCLGVAYDLPLGRRLVLTPSFAPGLYSHGHGLDLGYPIAFQSQLEAAYLLRGGARIGISLSHVSNARLGHTNNPGEETIMLHATIPVGVQRELRE
jgi:lipid A 3-O-deacylase